MRISPLPRATATVLGIGLAALSFSASMPVLGQTPSAPAAPALKADAVEPAAMDACLRAARQSLTTKGVPPVEVALNPPTVQPGPSTDSQALRGTGHWRGAGGVRNFNYSCNVDTRSSEALGLVLRDVTPASAEAPPPKPPTEPNVTELSPAACESSAAEALQQRWPRVTQITFDRDTRSFKQESAVKGELHGSGRAIATQGAPSTFFVFDCEIDPRDGRVLRTTIS